MFGEGSGGTIARLAAAADPRIKALDLVDPWGDWPDWLAKSSLVPDDERGDYLKPEFLKRPAPLDPMQRFSRVKATARLQCLSDPSVTPSIVRDRLAAAASPQTKVILHNEAVAQYKAASRTNFFNWIKDQLRPAPAH
jgi:cephalosporin-C deacetylase-like acetyl esterase